MTEPLPQSTPPPEVQPLSNCWFRAEANEINHLVAQFGDRPDILRPSLSGEHYRELNLEALAGSGVVDTGEKLRTNLRMLCDQFGKQHSTLVDAPLQSHISEKHSGLLPQPSIRFVLQQAQAIDLFFRQVDPQLLESQANNPDLAVIAQLLNVYLEKPEPGQSRAAKDPNDVKRVILSDKQTQEDQIKSRLRAYGVNS